MKYIIPTIDVEAIRTLSKLGNYDDFILGKVNNDFFGTTKIAQIINEYNGSGTFYIDFAESQHGINKLKKLSSDLLNFNSDVQLHIHPQFIADQSRYLLHQYDKNEQSVIVKKCIEIYEKCLEDRPVSFRAGGYGANDSTLEVLRDNGILIDSSYYHNHQWCQINSKPINVISKSNDLYELPITIFNNNISYKFFNLPIKNRIITKKLDIDGCSKEELKKGFNALVKNDTRVIILFLHSYSFIKWSPDYKNIKPDYEDIEKFKFILEYAISKNYKVESIKNISAKFELYLNDNSTLPEISTSRNLLSSFTTTFKNKYRFYKRGK